MLRNFKNSRLFNIFGSSSSKMNFSTSLNPRQVVEQINKVNPRLEITDPLMFDIIEREKKRQRESIVLIPSENFTSAAVMEALGSCMQNKYSEGYPGARYYGGNEMIDQAELETCKRALDVYGLDENEWGVNVQSLSGSPGNLYVYGALMNVGERMMGLDLPHGGHLSHGYQTNSKKISSISKYYQTMPYQTDPKTSLIDYSALSHLAHIYRPKVIVSGASAYSRLWEYEKIGNICRSVGAWHVSDMAHISGPIAAGVIEGPWKEADVVTTTTHKSLRGPRGCMIFYRKGLRMPGAQVSKDGKNSGTDIGKAIDFSVFPGHQGGPHNHTISALGVALLEAKSPEFKEYQTAVLKNSRIMSDEFLKLGYDIVSGGTDTHLLLLNLTRKGIDGARVERVLELCNIAVNKNTIPSDTSAMIPFGVRLGSPAMTTRGVSAQGFKTIVGFIDRAVDITKKINSATKGRKVSDFKKELGLGENSKALQDLKTEVISFARNFPTIGFNEQGMKYQ